MSRVRFPTFHLHIDFAPHPPPSYFSFIVGRPRLRNAPAREREWLAMGRLHYFDLYFIYYLATSSYAMTHQTNFNSLSGSREILDLREKKKLESIRIFFIAKRFINAYIESNRLEECDVKFFKFRFSVDSILLKCRRV